MASWGTCRFSSTLPLNAFFLNLFQLLQKSIPDFELNLARVFLPWLGNVIILLIFRRLPIIPRKFITWSLPAIIFHNITSLLHYVSVTFISLASFQCTATTVCLFSGIAVHRILNNDSLNVSKMVAICLCSVGICYAIQPEFLHPILGLSPPRTPESAINHSHINITDYYREKARGLSADELLGYILAVVDGVTWSLSIAMTRKLTSCDDFRKHYVSYLFWHFMFGILMSSGLMLVSNSHYISLFLLGLRLGICFAHLTDLTVYQQGMAKLRPSAHIQHERKI